jgi:EpsI family protein
MTAQRRRALLLLLTMGTGALGARALRPHDMVDEARAAVPLESLFPAIIGPWRTDRALDALVLGADLQARSYQSYDQVLERTYVREDGSQIMMSVAYGRQQSGLFQLHRPEVCYAAFGFQVSEPVPLRLQVSARTLAVTRLYAYKPGRQEPITYWTVLGDEVVADAQEFRWRKVFFGVQGRVLDGMLVRLSSIDADHERAWHQQAQFAALLDRELTPSARARVMGV